MAKTNLQPGFPLASPEMREFAAAWIDRFEAVGGYFGRVYSPQGETTDCGLGYPTPYAWEAPKLHNPRLSPCDLIVERSQQEGAVKMLMSFLTLVPGLKAAVYQLADEYGAVL